LLSFVRMSCSILSSDILIHRNQDTLPLTDFPSSEYFGIVSAKVSKTKIVKTPTFLLFTIDKTGSMADYASGNACKLDHVIQTFVNMMGYLAKLDTEMYVQVNSFNTIVDVTIERVMVTPDNVDDLIKIIKNLRPEGSTNIGLALQTANTVLTSYKNEFPEHQIGHVFMTDGEASTGVIAVDELVRYVDDDFYNTFVGFGLKHNVELLNKCGSKKNAEYQFVDNMENTALIYGETIHKFIYPAIRNAEFLVEGGSIYDWSTDEWTTSIKEPIIISEIEKIYHIRTRYPETVTVSIYGEQCSSAETEKNEDYNRDYGLLDVACSIPDLIDGDTELPYFNEDLTKYAFRQKIQELLFEAKQGIDSRSRQIQYKKELIEAFKTIRKYMRINNLREDGLLKMLCDDISVVYRTFDRQHGVMYASARCNSQGRQRTYNTNDTQDSDNIPAYPEPMFQRQNALARTPQYPPRPMLVRANTNSFQDVDEFLRANNADDVSSIGSRSPELSLEIEEDQINETTFTTYNECGFTSRYDTTVFRNLFGDDIDYLPEDQLEMYIPESCNTTCFATPGVVNTMRSMSHI